MRIEHLDEGVGRIVKGVNTTPDVGVNQTSIEAAKFGNKVDKDGRPPTLSKKVKGNSTNVLFNLGLAESIDTKTRTNFNQFVDFCCDQLGVKTSPQVRITDEIFDDTFGYFDAINKNITVSYANRHQMDTMRTIAHELVHHRQREDEEQLDGSDGSFHENEANAIAGLLLRRWAEKNPQLFSEKWTPMELALMEGGHDVPPRKQVSKKPGKIFAALENFDKKQNPEQWHQTMIEKYGEDTWYDMQDSVRDYYESNAILENTISDIIKLSKEHPLFTDYKGIKKLYRYVRKDNPGTDERFIPFAYNIKGAKNFVQSMMQGDMGFKKEDFVLVEKDFKPQDAILNFTNMIEWIYDLQGDDGEWYKREYEVWMKRTPYYSEGIQENFADGKKKGKSRPGRVKRAGASCKGSVSSLRAKARKYSGERGKMYHWCANMKAGRQKS